jgi:hypothetical protein
MISLILSVEMVSLLSRLPASVVKIANHVVTLTIFSIHTKNSPAKTREFFD